MYSTSTCVDSEVHSYFYLVLTDCMISTLTCTCRCVVQVHTHACTCMYVHVHVCMHMCMYRYVCTCTCTCMYAHVHVHVHVCSVIETRQSQTTMPKDNSSFFPKRKRRAASGGTRTCTCTDCTCTCMVFSPMCFHHICPHVHTHTHIQRPQDHHPGSCQCGQDMSPPALPHWKVCRHHLSEYHMYPTL